jgi:glucosamine--fructose-6-phosphate aminotransferase (isomerizing)
MVLTAFALAGKTTEGQKILQKAAAASSEVLSNKNVLHIKKLAQKIQNNTDMYIIGRGLSYPASLEAAIKIKEISYIHAEGLAAGELKHGPLALITKGTPCIVFAPLDETHGANLAGAMEMKARGGFIIGISPKNHPVFDYYLPVDDCQEATIIPGVVVSQLLAYHLAVVKKLDPHKPRNLAKSVTVK